MTYVPKNTNLLVVGIDPDEWRKSGVSGRIKSSLQSMDMAWGYVSNSRATVEDAIAFLDERDDV